MPWTSLETQKVVELAREVEIPRAKVETKRVEIQAQEKREGEISSDSASKRDKLSTKYHLLTR